MCCYFIAEDVLYFTLIGTVNSAKYDDMVKEREQWLNQLGMCDRTDIEQKNKIIATIHDIEKALLKKSYKIH